jgi:hypothetical protein
LLEFSSTDTATVRIKYIYGRFCEELIVASAYFPYDSVEPPPTKEMRDIIDYCQSRKKQLIVGCDANAHYILWGSTATNSRGKSLMELLVSSNLNILNSCTNLPLFFAIGKMLLTNRIGHLVSNWHVSDEPSLSDHRYICFQIGNITTNYITFWNPKRTKWESYKYNLNLILRLFREKYA